MGPALNANLHYEGSCAIDENLLDAADIRENERVDIWNVDNGERLSTYAIKAQRGSGIISVNGSAVRRADPGDKLIIATFALLEKKPTQADQPILAFVDSGNQIDARSCPHCDP